MGSTWLSPSRHLPFSAILNIGPFSSLLAVQHYLRLFRTVQALCDQKPCIMFGIAPNSSQHTPTAQQIPVRWSVPRRYAGFVIPPYPLHSLNSDAPSLNQRRGVYLRIDTSEAMLQAAKDALYPTYVSVDYDWLAMQATPVDEDGNSLPRQSPSGIAPAENNRPEANGLNDRAQQYGLSVNVDAAEERPLADLEREYKRMPPGNTTASSAVQTPQTTNQTAEEEHDHTTRANGQPNTPPVRYPVLRDHPFLLSVPLPGTTPPRTIRPPSPLRINDLFSSDDEDVDEDGQHVSPPPPYQMHICDFRIAP